MRAAVTTAPGQVRLVEAPLPQLAPGHVLVRESLYKSLSTTGNPSFQTIAKVVDALGGQLTVTPKEPAA